jgi:hypothetical protein
MRNRGRVDGAQGLGKGPHLQGPSGVEELKALDVERAALGQHPLSGGLGAGGEVVDEGLEEGVQPAEHLELSLLGPGPVRREVRVARLGVEAAEVALDLPQAAHQGAGALPHRHAAPCRGLCRLEECAGEHGDVVVDEGEQLPEARGAAGGREALGEAQEAPPRDLELELGVLGDVTLDGLLAGAVREAMELDVLQHEVAPIAVGVVHEEPPVPPIRVRCGSGSRA